MSKQGAKRAMSSLLSPNNRPGGKLLKAIVWTRYGTPDVLQLREVEKPAPGDNEVLIKVHATNVTTGDCEMRNLSGALWYTIPMRAYVGLTSPKRLTMLGMELAGEIVAIGKGVKQFKAGDQIFAATAFVDIGTYTEYKCLAENSEEGVMALKPVNMTWEEAAVVPVGGLEALHFLRKGNIQRGQKILINGAGGTIGTFAVQLARYFGAEVTAVDSTDKLDMLRSIGADKVIDYTQEDFTQNGEIYDVILDVVGKASFSRCIRSLKQNGCYLLANPRLSQMVCGFWTSKTSSKKVLFGTANGKSSDLIFLKELIEAGKIKSIIDRCYPLEQTIEAHRYVETGHKKGNVIINVV
jgi:2-desacetyl-2-hydroxyethyl bacteriochlorophyllide A dehydrogenase